MKFFDAHLHIIDNRFPLQPNQGYLPDSFTCEDYLARLNTYELAGGAVVSGSFQGFDQTYLVDALKTLGSNFVGVTQLPVSTPDEEILSLHKQGVRALRFNVNRGGSEALVHLDKFARRVHELVGWHVELYIQSTLLREIKPILLGLPAVSIDHLGLSKSGFKDLLSLVEQGVKVKATGFGRVDFDVQEALKGLYEANPDGLMFGTDLPSTRAPRPFEDNDITLIQEALGNSAAEKVLYKNALAFYGVAEEQARS